MTVIGQKESKFIFSKVIGPTQFLPPWGLVPPSSLLKSCLILTCCPLNFFWSIKVQVQVLYLLLPEGEEYISVRILFSLPFHFPFLLVHILWLPWDRGFGFLMSVKVLIQGESQDHKQFGLQTVRKLALNDVAHKAENFHFLQAGWNWLLY